MKSREYKIINAKFFFFSKFHYSLHLSKKSKWDFKIHEMFFLLFYLDINSSNLIRNAQYLLCLTRPEWGPWYTCRLDTDSMSSCRGPSPGCVPARAPPWWLPESAGSWNPVPERKTVNIKYMQTTVVHLCLHCSIGTCFNRSLKWWQTCTYKFKLFILHNIKY